MPIGVLLRHSIAEFAQVDSYQQIWIQLRHLFLRPTIAIIVQ